MSKIMTIELRHFGNWDMDQLRELEQDDRIFSINSVDTKNTVNRNQFKIIYDTSIPIKSRIVNFIKSIDNVYSIKIKNIS